MAESNPDDDAIGAVVKADLMKRPEAIIVAGISLDILGAKRMVREMCGTVRGRRDRVAVWISRGPAPVGKDFEDCWNLVVTGAKMRRWNDEGNDLKDCTDPKKKGQRKKKSWIKVLFKSAKRILLRRGVVRLTGY